MAVAEFLPAEGAVGPPEEWSHSGHPLGLSQNTKKVSKFMRKNMSAKFFLCKNVSLI